MTSLLGFAIAVAVRRKIGCGTGLNWMTISGSACSASACRCAGRTARRPTASCRPRPSSRRTSRCGSSGFSAFVVVAGAPASPSISARRVLAGDGAALHVLRCDRLSACRTLSFSSRTGRGRQGRRFHRHQAHQLQTGGSAPCRAAHRSCRNSRRGPSSAERFGDGDLHVVDMSLRFHSGSKKLLAKRSHQQVLHAFPCPGNGRCGRSGIPRKTASYGVVDGTADARSWPIGFSSTTRDDASTSLWVARCAETGPNKLGAQAR